LALLGIVVLSARLLRSKSAAAPDAGVERVVLPDPSPFVFPEDAAVAEPDDTHDAGAPALEATVRVQCEPAAEVIIDKRSWGRTPVSAEVGPGAHQLVLKGREHFRRVLAFKLEPGEVKNLSILAKKGTLRLEVTPFALIKLNGEVLGTTSFKEVELYEGVHTVEFELSDSSMTQKIARKLQVTIKPGEQTLVHESLLP
jgi:hypothetical protein